jgi:hypothetical protein
MTGLLITSTLTLEVCLVAKLLLSMPSNFLILGFGFNYFHLPSITLEPFYLSFSYRKSLRPNRTPILNP